MAIKVGELVVDLAANTASFAAGMEKSTRLALDSSKNIQRSFSYIAAGAAGAAVAVGGAFAKIITDSMKTVGEMHHMALEVGTTTEEFSKLAFASKMAGVPLETTTKGLEKLSRTAFQAANGNKQAGKLFDSLGVSVLDAGGHMKESGELMTDIAHRLGTMKDGTAKTAYEMLIFGRSGAELAPLLKKLGNDHGELAAQAAKLGVVVSEQTAEGVKILGRQMKLLQAGSEGLGLTLLSDTLPAMNRFAAQIASLTGSGQTQSLAHMLGGELSKGIDDAGKSLDFLTQHLTLVKTALGGVAAIQVGRILLPMIASAVSAGSGFELMSLAAGSLIGRVTGISAIAKATTTIIGPAAQAGAAYISLARTEGIAETASYAFAGSQKAVLLALTSTAGALAFLTAGVAVFGYAIYDTKQKATEAAHAAVTWADTWTGALSNVKETLTDISALLDIIAGNPAAAAMLHFTSLKDSSIAAMRKRQHDEAQKGNYTGEGYQGKDETAARDAATAAASDAAKPDYVPTGLFDPKAKDYTKADAQAQMKEYETYIEELKDTRKLNLSEEHNFWLTILLETKVGSENFLAVLKHFHQTAIETMSAPLLTAALSTQGGSKSWLSGLDEISKGIEDDTQKLIRADKAREAASHASRAGSLSHEASQIQSEAALGMISPLGEMNAMRDIHQREIAETIRYLEEQMGLAQEDAAKQIELGQAIADAKRQQQEALTRDTIEMALRTREQWLQSLSGVNQQLTALMTGQKTNWSGMFLGEASKMANAGLTRIEGAGMKALGIGKADGSDMNPWSVKITNWMEGNFGGGNTPSIAGAAQSATSAISAAASSTGAGIGSFLKAGLSLIPGGSFISSLFQGLHFAGGGSVMAGVPIDVGDMGRETFVPQQAGHMIPNKSLGGSTAYYSIDASGANAAEVDQRVSRALVLVHGSAVKSSIAANREMARRRPRSSGA